MEPDFFTFVSVVRLPTTLCCFENANSVKVMELSPAQLINYLQECNEHRQNHSDILTSYGSDPSYSVQYESQSDRLIWK